MTNDLTDEELLKSDLIIIHALPAGGKSTWGREIVESNPEKYVQVERDNIRMSLFGEEYHDIGWSKRNEKKVSAAQHKLIIEAFEKGQTVISSDNNLDSRLLPALANLALDRGLTFSQKYFDVPVEECKRRNKQRLDEGGHYVPEEYIDMMVEQGYGRDGRIKEFRIGRNECVAFDRSDSEK